MHIASPAPRASSTGEAAPGLRERNRVRRTRRVERAALELALEHGVDAVTVDMICEASDVSPRTYFNYFGTKEGALLGAAPSTPTSEAVEEFVYARGPIVEDLMIIMARAFFATEPDPEVFAMRRLLFEREPALQSLRLMRLADKRQATAAIVRRRLAVQHPELTEDEASDQTHLVVSIVMGAFPVISRQWLAHPGDAAHAETLIRAAIDKIRRIVTPDA